VYDIVDFAFVFICNGYVGFFQNSVKPFPATQKKFTILKLAVARYNFFESVERAKEWLK
jgi:hypothetical protein